MLLDAVVLQKIRDAYHTAEISTTPIWDGSRGLHSDISVWLLFSDTNGQVLFIIYYLNQL